MSRRRIVAGRGAAVRIDAGHDHRDIHRRVVIRRGSQSRSSWRQLRPAPSSSLNRRKRRRSGPTKSDVEALLCDVCLPDGDRIRGQLFINIRAGAAEGGRGKKNDRIRYV